MEEVFRPDGHLSDPALAALAGNWDVFSQLQRLEAAEQLAFCDLCLQRYTELLTAEESALLVPERSCQRSLWTRIRLHAFQAITSRYATAAAAVTLALTVLWGGAGADFSRRELPEDRPSAVQQLNGLAGELNDSLREATSGLSAFFDGLRPGQFMQGGNHT